MQVDDAQNIDVVMPMYNLIEYSDVYSKTSESLWQNYWDEPALNKIGDVIDFPENKNNTNLFKVKQQIAGKTRNGGRKDAEIMVPLKYLSNFWKTLEMYLINCETSFRLKWPRKCIIVAGTANNQNPTFQINDTKLYIAVVTSPIKLLKQLELGFKRAINWNKYLAKTINQAQKRYLDYLIDPSFQGVTRLFVLSFKDHGVWESHKQYYLPPVEIKDYNVMINESNLF